MDVLEIEIPASLEDDTLHHSNHSGSRGPASMKQCRNRKRELGRKLKLAHYKLNLMRRFMKEERGTDYTFKEWLEEHGIDLKSGFVDISKQGYFRPDPDVLPEQGHLSLDEVSMASGDKLGRNTIGYYVPGIGELPDEQALEFGLGDVGGFEADEIGDFSLYSGEDYDDAQEYAEYLEELYDNMEDQFDHIEELEDRFDGDYSNAGGRARRKAKRQGRKASRKKRKELRKAQQGNRQVRRAEKKADRKDRQAANRDFRKGKRDSRKEIRNLPKGDRKAARKKRRGTIKDYKKARREQRKEENRGFFRGIKKGITKVSHWPIRGGVLAGIRTNLFGIATRLQPAFAPRQTLSKYKPGEVEKAQAAWEKISKRWVKILGGNKDTLRNSIMRGYTRKPWAIKKKDYAKEDRRLTGKERREARRAKFSGAAGQYLEVKWDGTTEQEYSQEAAATAAIIVAGLGALATIVGIMSKHKLAKNPYVNPDDAPGDYKKAVDDGIIPDDVEDVGAAFIDKEGNFRDPVSKKIVDPETGEILPDSLQEPYEEVFDMTDGEQGTDPFDRDLIWGMPSMVVYVGGGLIGAGVLFGLYKLIVHLKKK